jgi:hypothetical protein
MFGSSLPLSQHAISVRRVQAEFELRGAAHMLRFERGRPALPPMPAVAPPGWEPVGTPACATL